MAIQDQIKRSLEKHRLNTRTLVAYLMFGAIILVFVLFGFPGGGPGKMGQGIVAEVNGRIISGADLKEEIDQLERFYSQMFGGNFGMQGQRQMLETQALENLITREVLAQEAYRAGILVSDKEVRDFILDISAFQEQGRFDRDRYFRYLEVTRNTADEFETKIRKEAQRMRVKRLFDAVDQTPSKLRSEKEAQMSALRLNVQFAKMDREALAKTVKVTEAEVTDYMAQPENVKKIEVDYETHKKDLYSVEEKVKAQHILIKAKEGDAEAEKKALTRISDLKVRATKEDFASLAKSHSEDEGSKMNGGDLGFFGRGQMVPAFESASFAAKPGELVGPVKTNFGYHLIKVLERQEASVSPIEDVKTDIARRLIAERNLDEKLQKLEEALNNKNDSEVEAQLKAWGIKWEETGEFDVLAESIPQLPANETVKDAVWSLGAAGQWHPHLIRDGSLRIVLRMKDVQKGDPKALASAAPPQLAMGGVFEGWLESIRQSSKVVRNVKGSSLE